MESTEPIIDQDLFGIKDLNVLRAIAISFGLNPDGRSAALLRIEIHKARRT